MCFCMYLRSRNGGVPWSSSENALYGLGLWAEYGHSSFKPVVREALSRINVVIMHINALEPENIDASDNAVYALGIICQFHGESIDSAQIIPAWLNCLPIKADLDEIRDTHEHLCLLIEREFLGPSYQYLSRIISIFTEVLCVGKDLAIEDTTIRIISLLRHFQKTLPPAIWSSACLLLLPQQNVELESVLSPEGDVNL